MLSKQFRFHGLGSLNFVYKNGKTARSSLLLLRYAVNRRQTHPRIAVVVSRKVHKSAVVRNRIRRRVYAVIRQELPKDIPPHDLVFTVFSERVANIGSDELQQTIVDLLQKAKLHP